MKKYRAIKDVPSWGIKAGEVYDTNGGWVNAYVYNALEPLLEAGIIEEVPERFTVENIKNGYEYWYVTDDDVHYDTWSNRQCDRERAKIGIFRTLVEVKARREKIIAYCKELDAKNE